MVPVTCGSCGTVLDEDGGLKPDEPCPVCGSMARNFQLTASPISTLGATISPAVISVDVQSIARVSSLLLQAVIVPGDRTAEGRLIEAVAIPWFDIIDLLKIDPSIAR